jgi:phospholipid/cholesterol/gamma-HCH transport system ATP-binding protein
MNKPVIQVLNFKKSYGTKVIHSGVSFEVFKGECVGLVGGSGAGKSVFLRSLIGLERPDSGNVIFKGNDITGLKEHQLVEVRKKIAYIFQGGALFDSMSVYENLAYPLREHTKLTESEISTKVHDLLTDFGLSHTTNLLPSELSGGMQKRIGLARGIILEPEVILYDEPTAGLDPSNTKNIQSLILRSKKHGVTSILVTHDMPTAFAVCDRICLLKKGKIIASGTIKELENKDTGPIAEYVHGEEEVL